MSAAPEGFETRGFVWQTGPRSVMLHPTSRTHWVRPKPGAPGGFATLCGRGPRDRLTTWREPLDSPPTCSACITAHRKRGEEFEISRAALAYEAPVLPPVPRCPVPRCHGAVRFRLTPIAPGEPMTINACLRHLGELAALHERAIVERA